MQGKLVSQKAIVFIFVLAAEQKPPIASLINRGRVSNTIGESSIRRQDKDLIIRHWNFH